MVSLLSRSAKWAGSRWRLGIAGWLCVMAALAVTGIPLHPTSAPSPTNCARTGFFVSSDSPSSISSVASDLGVRSQMMSIYAGPPNWTQFDALYIPRTRMQLVLAVGRISRKSAYEIGRELVAAGHAKTVIRIMWEMNGDWFPWGVQAMSAGQYIAAYRSIVAGFRSVPRGRFSYVWNLNAGNGGTQEFATYPGSAYVSNVGIDWYAQNGSGGSPASAVAPILAFARSHHKPISIDEWGVDGVSNASSYLREIGAVLHDPANHVAFQIYFDYGRSRITNYPADEAAYRSDVAGVC